jgi:hypothetical protein
VPDFDSFAVLLIVFPLSFISSTLCIDIYSEAICFVIDPLAFVNISINMIEFSSSESLTIIPLSFINGSISPFHSPSSMAEPTKPFTAVLSPILIRISLDEWFLACLEEAMKSFFRLFLCEIL